MITEGETYLVAGRHSPFRHLQGVLAASGRLTLGGGLRLTIFAALFLVLVLVLVLVFSPRKAAAFAVKAHSVESSVVCI